MSKGNPFLGQARGKLGDIVLTRVGGEQVARSRNRHPRNPQTPAQMFQRGTLATVSEMYIRGTRNFFKYAFMTKTAAQSEFNKFCQINIGRVPCNSPAALKAGAPAIGNFIMTQGTLQQMHLESTLESMILRMRNNVAEGAFETWTVGDVSKAFMETYGYQIGDIITVLDIHSAATPFSTINDMIANEALTSIAGVSVWDIKQFRLDPTSADLASTLNIFSSGSSDNVLALRGNYEMSAQNVEGWAIVCSRNVKSGVLVSTSEIVCNPATQVAINLGMSDEWKEAVARYWVPSSQSEIDPINILQGSLSVPQRVAPEPETNYVVSTAPVLPSSATSITATMQYSIEEAAGATVGRVIGHVDVEGVTQDIKVSSAGNRIDLTAGALSLAWARGGNTVAITNSASRTVANLVIDVDIR